MHCPIHLAAALFLGLVHAPCLSGAEPVPLVSSTPPGTAPTPPGQRLQGPGGSDYTHDGWRQSLHGVDAAAYWLFEPADPVPASAPLVVFLHGWAAIDPWFYGAWVEHLVRRGNVVLFPRYQSTLFSSPSDFAANAMTALRDGMKELSGEGHVKLQPGRVAFAGHSMGGVLAADLAACAGKEGLPRPKAVMCVQPGGTRRAGGSFGLELSDLKTIPMGTLLLSVAGDRDSVVGDQDAVAIYKAASHLPAADRNLVYFLSDEHGSPPLRSNHYAPCSLPCQFCEAPGDPPSGTYPTRLAAIFGIAVGDFVPLKNLLQTRHGQDWMHSRDTCPVYAETFYAPDATDFDHWRLLDALCDAAFTGKNRDIALGNTPAQRDRGKWSDGRPVKELKVVTGNGGK